MSRPEEMLSICSFRECTIVIRELWGCKNSSRSPYARVGEATEGSGGRGLIGKRSQKQPGQEKTEEKEQLKTTQSQYREGGTRCRWGHMRNWPPLAAVWKGASKAGTAIFCVMNENLPV